MNKTVLIILGLIVAGTVGVYIFTSSGAPSDTAQPQETEETAQNVSEKETMSEAESQEKFMGSVTDLFAAGKDVTCTFKREDEGGTVEGTVYISKGEQMRGDFTMNDPRTGEFTGHTIQDGEWIYTWGGPLGEKTGTKIKIDTTQEPEDTMTETEEAGRDTTFEEDMEYDCTAWKVDVSKFTPPSDVTFTDLSAQMQEMNEAMGDVQEMQCSACDQAPEGSAREQCKQALGCT